MEIVCTACIKKRALVLAVSALYASLRLCEAAPTLSLSHTVIYGPAVHPKRCSLPVNYFYVQAKDTDGNNYADVIESTFDVSYEAEDASGVPITRIRLRSGVFNLRDGLFLYQFRVFDDYKSVKISVRYRGKHVAGSPYTVGPVFHENCACPLRSAEEWMSDFKCPESESQIRADLEQFREAGGINITNLYERGGEMFPRNSFIHYSIVDGKLYAQKFGSITGFKFMSDMTLLSLVNKGTFEKMHLPDMELLVNLGDWPLVKAARMPVFPVFSWCGSPDTRDIVWPTWDLMKSTVMGFDRVSLTTLSVQRTRGDPWEEREPRAFFRGRDSNRERLDLVRLHRNNTQLFNVALTNWFFFKDEYSEEVYGPKEKNVGFHEFFKYKYQINMDGTVAAYRFPYLMGGGSLILKQHSQYYEHFYRHLKPWVHYVPMKRDISDVVERLQWALDHDDKAREIARNAYQYLHDNLLPQHLYCYVARLLSLYSRHQVGATPTIHPGMEPVVPEVPHDCSNTCQKLQSGAQNTKDEL